MRSGTVLGDTCYCRAPPLPDRHTRHSDPDMDFSRLHGDTSCDCVRHRVAENTSSTFLMALAGAIPTEDDFRTNWEKGARGKAPDCDEIRMRKGLSMNKRQRDNESEVVEKYRATLRFKPRSPRKFYCHLRCNTGAGVFMATPSPRDPSHHTFFKSDAFTLRSIVIESVHPL